MDKQYGKGKCDVVSHRARLEFLVGLPSLLQSRIHKQIHFRDPGANPLPSCPFTHAGRWVASKMICIQIYRTGTRMGESQKLATGKDPPDQASAVKCSTPKPRRQKKTGTSSFCFGSPDPKCKNYLAINTIRALLPPILAHFLHRWPPGGVPHSTYRKRLSVMPFLSFQPRVIPANFHPEIIFYIYISIV